MGTGAFQAAYIRPTIEITDRSSSAKTINKEKQTEQNIERKPNTMGRHVDTFLHEDKTYRR